MVTDESHRFSLVRTTFRAKFDSHGVSDAVNPWASSTSIDVTTPARDQFLEVVDYVSSKGHIGDAS